MNAVRLLFVAALVALAAAQQNFPIPNLGGNTCDVSSTVCLLEGEGDCNRRAYSNRECASGLYCKLGTVQNTTTGEFVGTCMSAATLGQACSLENGNQVPCYDANFPNAIFCDDPLRNSNGTCKWAPIFYPGEACAPNDPNFVNGGCIYGTCTNSKCSTLDSATQCDRQNQESQCPFGTYCDLNGNGNGNSFCVARKQLNSQCGDSYDDYECAANLVCTSRGGLFSVQTCLEPFVGNEGDTCSNEFDCKAGLLCAGGSCVSPAIYRNDFCASDNDCQTGWGCSCAYKTSGHKVIYQGGKCSQKLVLTNDDINRVKKFQQCAIDTSCVADLSYLSEFGFDAIIDRSKTSPASCLFDCYKQAGYPVGDLAGNPAGKCVAKSKNAAGMVVPAMAAIVLALLALLM